MQKRLLLFAFICIANIALGFSAVAEIPSDTLKTDRATVMDRRTFPEGFKEQYSGKEYIYETVVNPNNWFNRLKQWFNDLINRLFNLGNQEKAAEISRILMRVLYAVIVLLVIYFIVRAILNKEGNWIFGRYSDKKLSKIQDVENNIHQVDFPTLIADAEKDRDYRLAIRYYYLWLLKVLSNKELIEYDVEKTNSDYVNELEGDSLKKQFSYASYLYNYVWYGEFSIAEAEYETTSKRFQTFINSGGK
ncbi:DUF4129 domain-containing protein [Galbibacter sp. EGI 63066]|uniref:DUF4129 domain-containing protein n=1 Tax=Galbibacter sp. EGI 63066 TaxID=2993559 RepID=UPI0022498879|nr:DUF4129 domain-containing protein [Galbibacter sp. EGI 63066]MCX2681455.1 DUF4129 domain-containing protein [Galbibacter sp. EGI 63066]